MVERGICEIVDTEVEYDNIWAIPKTVVRQSQQGLIRAVRGHPQIDHLTTAMPLPPTSVIVQQIRQLAGPCRTRCTS